MLSGCDNLSGYERVVYDKTNYPPPDEFVKNIKAVVSLHRTKIIYCRKPAKAKTKLCSSNSLKENFKLLVRAGKQELFSPLFSCIVAAKHATTSQEPIFYSSTTMMMMLMFRPSFPADQEFSRLEESTA